jgi:immunoglobulin-binding protein 1
MNRGGPLLSKEGKPLQPFTITDRRTQLRQGVFRPGHSLPTMTIEDYLEEEKRRGGIIDGGGETQNPAAAPDEDNMELADQETMKARAWDEYAEANPKGSGNTLNRG